MLIASDAIREQFPWEADKWLTDGSYCLPSLAEASDLLDKLIFFMPKPMIGIAECEDLAIILMGRLREYRANNAEIKRNWPFGIAMGTRFNGVDKNHTVNIFVADEGVYCFDAQTNQTWEATDENIYFIFM